MIQVRVFSCPEHPVKCSKINLQDDDIQTILSTRTFSLLNQTPSGQHAICVTRVKLAFQSKSSDGAIKTFAPFLVPFYPTSLTISSISYSGETPENYRLTNLISSLQEECVLSNSLAVSFSNDSITSTTTISITATATLVTTTTTTTSTPPLSPVSFQTDTLTYGNVYVYVAYIFFWTPSHQRGSFASRVV